MGTLSSPSGQSQRGSQNRREEELHEQSAALLPVPTPEPPVPLRHPVDQRQRKKHRAGRKDTRSVTPQLVAGNSHEAAHDAPPVNAMKISSTPIGSARAPGC